MMAEKRSRKEVWRDYWIPVLHGGAEVAGSWSAARNKAEARRDAEVWFDAQGYTTEAGYSLGEPEIMP